MKYIQNSFILEEFVSKKDYLFIIYLLHQMWSEERNVQVAKLLYTY